MPGVQQSDHREGRWPDNSYQQREETATRKRAYLSESMPKTFLKRFVEGRIFEWVMTLSAIMMGAEILIFPETLSRGAFKYVLIMADEITIGVSIVVIGWIRLSALMLNGQRIGGRKLGPLIRAIAAVFSSTVWTQFVVALFQLSLTQGYPSPGIPFWVMCTIGELYVAYQTVKND